MNNSKTYSGSKKGVARFVKDQLDLLSPDYVQITIIKRDISGDSYATSATVASSADIERHLASYSLGQQPTISQDPTQVG